MRAPGLPGRARPDWPVPPFKMVGKQLRDRYGRFADMPDLLRVLDNADKVAPAMKWTPQRFRAEMLAALPPQMLPLLAQERHIDVPAGSDRRAAIIHMVRSWRPAAPGEADKPAAKPAKRGGSRDGDDLAGRVDALTEQVAKLTEAITPTTQQAKPGHWPHDMPGGLAGKRILSGPDGIDDIGVALRRLDQDGRSDLLEHLDAKTLRSVARAFTATKPPTKATDEDLRGHIAEHFDSDLVDAEPDRGPLPDDADLLTRLAWIGAADTARRREKLAQERLDAINAAHLDFDGLIELAHDTGVDVDFVDWDQVDDPEGTLASYLAQQIRPPGVERESYGPVSERKVLEELPPEPRRPGRPKKVASATPPRTTADRTPVQRQQVEREPRRPAEVRFDEQRAKSFPARDGSGSVDAYLRRRRAGADWLVRDPDGTVRVMTDNDFRARYEVRGRGRPRTRPAPDRSAPRRPRGRPRRDDAAGRAAQVASALHEDWRETFHENWRASGEPGKPTKPQPTTDQAWIDAHGTDEVDIANTAYADLPKDWQAKNKAAADVVSAILARYDGHVDLSDEQVRRSVGTEIHEAWLDRNGWARGGDLDVPFVDLPADEQAKDIDQVEVAMRALADHERTVRSGMSAFTRNYGGNCVAAGLLVRAADTGRVLLAQRALADDDPNGGLFEPPGGKLEPGEEPLDAAMREWSEETGLALPDGEVGDCWECPRYIGYVFHIDSEDELNLYLGRDLDSDPDADDDQISALAWFDPGEHLTGSNPSLRPEFRASLPQVRAALEAEPKVEMFHDPSRAVTPKVAELALFIVDTLMDGEYTEVQRAAREAYARRWNIDGSFIRARVPHVRVPHVDGPYVPKLPIRPDASGKYLRDANGKLMGRVPKVVMQMTPQGRGRVLAEYGQRRLAGWSHGEAMSVAARLPRRRARKRPPAVSMPAIQTQRGDRIYHSGVHIRLTKRPRVDGDELVLEGYVLGGEMVDGRRRRKPATIHLGRNENVSVQPMPAAKAKRGDLVVHEGRHYRLDTGFEEAERFSPGEPDGKGLRATATRVDGVGGPVTLWLAPDESVEVRHRPSRRTSTGKVDEPGRKPRRVDDVGPGEAWADDIAEGLHIGPGVLRQLARQHEEGESPESMARELDDAASDYAHGDREDRAYAKQLEQLAARLRDIKPRGAGKRLTHAAQAPDTRRQGPRVPLGEERQRLAKALVYGYVSGLSERELAEASGYSTGFVNRVLTESGIQKRRGPGRRRPPDEAARRERGRAAGLARVRDAVEQNAAVEAARKARAKKAAPAKAAKAAPAKATKPPTEAAGSALDRLSPGSRRALDAVAAVGRIDAQRAGEPDEVDPLIREGLVQWRGSALELSDEGIRALRAEHDAPAKKAAPAKAEVAQALAGLRLRTQAAGTAAEKFGRDLASGRTTPAKVRQWAEGVLRDNTDEAYADDVRRIVDALESVAKPAKAAAAAPERGAARTPPAENRTSPAMLDRVLARVDASDIEVLHGGRWVAYSQTIRDAYGRNDTVVWRRRSLQPRGATPAKATPRKATVADAQDDDVSDEFKARLAESRRRVESAIAATVTAEQFRAMSRDERLAKLREVAAAADFNTYDLSGGRGWARHVLDGLTVDELREMVDQLADISNWGTSEKRDRRTLAQAIQNLTGLNPDGYVDTAQGRVTFNERRSTKAATPRAATPRRPSGMSDKDWDAYLSWERDNPGKSVAQWKAERTARSPRSGGSRRRASSDDSDEVDRGSVPPASESTAPAKGGGGPDLQVIFDGARTSADVQRVAEAEAKRLTGRRVRFDWGATDPRVATEWSSGILRGFERFPNTALEDLWAADRIPHQDVLPEEVKVGLPVRRMSDGRIGVLVDDTVTAGRVRVRFDGDEPTNVDLASLRHDYDKVFAITAADGSEVVFRRIPPADYRTWLGRAGRSRHLAVGTPEGIALHEFGHAVINGMSEADGQEVLDAARQWAREHGMELSQAATRYLSYYARGGDHELLAEAFAQVMAGALPSEFAQAIVAKMDEVTIRREVRRDR